MKREEIARARLRFFLLQSWQGEEFKGTFFFSKSYSFAYGKMRSSFIRVFFSCFFVCFGSFVFLKALLLLDGCLELRVFCQCWGV